MTASPTPLSREEYVAVFNAAADIFIHYHEVKKIPLFPMDRIHIDEQAPERFDHAFEFAAAAFMRNRQKIISPPPSP